MPFYKPDIHITLVDALRPADELHYFPGETNVRMADVILISKVDQLSSLQTAKKQAEVLRQKGLIKNVTPVFFGKSTITPEARDPNTGELLSQEEATKLIKGKRVLVIDDGPTLTHGGMKYGAVSGNMFGLSFCFPGVSSSQSVFFSFSNNYRALSWPSN